MIFTVPVQTSDHLKPPESICDESSEQFVIHGHLKAWIPFGDGRSTSEAAPKASGSAQTVKRRHRTGVVAGEPLLSRRGAADCRTVEGVIAWLHLIYPPQAWSTHTRGTWIHVADCS